MFAPHIGWLGFRGITIELSSDRIILVRQAWKLIHTHGLIRFCIYRRAGERQQTNELIQLQHDCARRFSFPTDFNRQLRSWISKYSRVINEYSADLISDPLIGYSVHEMRRPRVIALADVQLDDLSLERERKILISIQKWKRKDPWCICLIRRKQSGLLAFLESDKPAIKADCAITAYLSQSSLSNPLWILSPKLTKQFSTHLRLLLYIYIL